jgi:hypothetical protein
VKTELKFTVTLTVDHVDDITPVDIQYAKEGIEDALEREYENVGFTRALFNGVVKDYKAEVVK